MLVSEEGTSVIVALIPVTPQTQTEEGIEGAGRRGGKAKDMVRRTKTMKHMNSNSLQLILKVLKEQLKTELPDKCWPIQKAEKVLARLTTQEDVCRLKGCSQARYSSCR